MAYGRASRMTPTSENGAPQRHMATGCIPGPMATGMRDSGRCASSMEMEQTPSAQEMSTLENTMMASPKAEENTLGPMARFIPENSRKD